MNRQLMTSESHISSIDYQATIFVRSFICECDVVLERYRIICFTLARIGSRLVQVLMLAAVTGEVFKASIRSIISPGSGGSAIVSASGNLLNKSALASYFPGRYLML